MAEFKSIFGKVLQIAPPTGKPKGEVYIRFNGGAGGVYTDALPLAQAILDAAGVDAVVLTDLPKVEKKPDRLVADNRTEFQWGHPDRPASLWREVRRYAALARYIEQNPPVDPRVEELKADIRSAVLAPDDSTVDLITKQLLARGWTKA